MCSKNFLILRTHEKRPLNRHTLLRDFSSATYILRHDRRHAIGYARCSTDKQDLAAQQARLSRKLGVAPERIYTDRGLTGTNRARPGLDQALAAVRAGDTLVVPKLDRLARSVPDARQIADALGGPRRQAGAG